MLTFMLFPKAHRTQVHSTNPLERLNTGVKTADSRRRHLPNQPAGVQSTRTVNKYASEGFGPFLH